MQNLVSFIIVNRNGKNLEDVIKNINDVYYDLKKEILIIEQFDNKPFLRGQLFNIGVKFSKGNYIALSDNDIYHLRKVDWIDVYNMVEKPIVGFKYISQLYLNNNVPVITKTEVRPTGFGAFNFMKKDDFIKCNGFSNLYVGWGCEDNAFVSRFDFIKLPQNLGHISHPKRVNEYKKNTEYNRELYNTNKSRNSKLDGYEQTTFNLVSEEIIQENVKLIKVNDISVCKDFAYKDILDKQYSLIK